MYLQLSSFTLHLDTSQRGDSATNHTVDVWITGKRACTTVGTRHDHVLPPARSNAPRHTHAEMILPMYQHELNMDVIRPRYHREV